MYFKHSQSDKLTDELFENPTNDYRGIPFWAWNTELDKDQITRQIGYFEEMGFGGFQMHSRAGLKTEYLGEKFMDCIAHGAQIAEGKGMLSWLYDEDRWPSGSAGGLVTKDPAMRERKLYFTPQRRRQDYVKKNTALQTGEPYFVAAYDIQLDEKGQLIGCRQIGIDEDAVYDKWYAECCCDGGAGWFNGQTYLDILNPQAVKRFLDITYERYKDTVGEAFGKQIPAIFFDEPAFPACQRMNSPFAKESVSLAWTGDLEQSFAQEYDMDLIAHLPELFWELPDGLSSRFRYCFFDHLASRFVSAFTDQIAQWCRKNGILCTGHFLGEGSFDMTVSRSGEIMRHYYYMDIPGIDTLTDSVQLTTLHQARSVDNQQGGNGIVSELYGVTNWDFDFRGHKYMGDWQTAVGVTIRVPHLAHMSLEGESKRDFPPSIFYQSAWYKDYRMVEDHFSRLHTALTRGKQLVRVAMIHPLETAWINYGNKAETAQKIWTLGDRFRDITKHLTAHQVSVDYICEDLLPKQCAVGENPLQVGQMAYDTIIVPCCETLRHSTLERLQKFRKNGGKLIFVGDCPRCVNGVPSDAVQTLYGESVHIEYNLGKLLSLLEDQRELRICNVGGGDADCFISQLRQDGNGKWLFIARNKREEFIDLPVPQAIQIRLKGHYAIKEYRTLDGTIHTCAPTYEEDTTVLPVTLYQQDSLLLWLEETEEQPASLPVAAAANPVKTLDFKRAVAYTLSEPNVLLLDRPAYAYDDGEWQDEEDILRITRDFKTVLGYPRDSTQPWALPQEGKVHMLHLRYTVYSDINYTGARLGIENCEETTITFNGCVVDIQPNGYYMDECIETVALPPLHKGENILTVDIPFNRRTFPECLYLLGEFGVRLAGAQPTVTVLPDKLGFSDITAQELPFYSGRITYHTEIEVPENSGITIRALQYRGACLKVSVDGQAVGQLTFAPHSVNIQGISAGKHAVDFEFCCTRYNTLAPLHRADSRARFAEPPAWRTQGDVWTYNYLVKPNGILISPTVDVYS